MGILTDLINVLRGEANPYIVLGRTLGSIVGIGLLAWLVWALFCRRRERDAGKKG
jgi:hypothetical protein